ncbi:hypothetical protein CANARDRAFT_208391 [[Candida] arabinofermentans NRRL YB-2248]|uniref:Seipin n=1 Tax=[Candida] arabinofermentans NRRL YB-2248 TaxID=983967 RepID=A0A1E4SXV5_9ASCO|nr:hypothetical protein CANARDRAFT_208391 [[Candida] arabinofermentans NRRL YB-2248]
MHINIAIPLKLTRTTIYFLLTASSIFLILLPWSVITYIRFHSTIIPTPIFKRQLDLNYEFRDRGAYALINGWELYSRLVGYGASGESGSGMAGLSDFVSDFEVNLKFKCECLDTNGLIGSGLVASRFSILDDSVLNHELKPWELDLKVVDLKSQYVNLWPITDNLRRSLLFDDNSNYLTNSDNLWSWPTERLEADQHYLLDQQHQRSDGLKHETQQKSIFHLWKFWTSQQHIHRGVVGGGGEILHQKYGVYYTITRYFPISCPMLPSTLMTAKKSKLIPPFLTYFLPPILTEQLDYEPTRQLKLMSLQLNAGLFNAWNMKNQEDIARHMKIVIEFNRPFVFFKDLELEVVRKFKGVRWIIYNYPTLSFLIGVSICWAVSSIICLSVSMLLYWYLTSEKTEMNEDDTYVTKTHLSKSFGSKEKDDLDYNLIKKEDPEDESRRVALKNLNKLLQQ